MRRTEADDSTISQHSCGSGTFRGARVKCLERARGIEPRPTAWKAVILPLNHARDVLPFR